MADSERRDMAGWGTVRTARTARQTRPSMVQDGAALRIANEITAAQAKKYLHKPRPRKYRNQPTIINGIRFDSKKEAEFFLLLKKAEGIKATEIQRIHRQVIFDLPGEITYRCDFMVIWYDGSISYYDVKGGKKKGTRTEVYRIKKRQVEALYGVEIKEV